MDNIFRVNLTDMTIKIEAVPPHGPVSVAGP